MGNLSASYPEILYEKIDTLPEGEFLDILDLGETIYLVGEISYTISKGSVEKWPDIGQITGVLQDTNGRIWFCGSTGIGWIGDDGPVILNEVDGQFVWEMGFTSDAIIYVTLGEVGQFDLEGNLINRWPLDLSPRPVLINDMHGEVAIVSGSSGLYILDQDGLRLMMNNTPEEFGGQFAWGLQNPDGNWILGTPTTLVRLNKSYEVEILESDTYTELFDGGISNSVDYDGGVLVVDYPTGAALLSKSDFKVKGLATQNQKEELGVVYRARPKADGGIYLLGTLGIGVLYPHTAARIYDGSQLWRSYEPIRILEASDSILVHTPEGMYRFHPDNSSFYEQVDFANIAWSLKTEKYAYGGALYKAWRNNLEDLTDFEAFEFEAAVTSAISGDDDDIFTLGPAGLAHVTLLEEEPQEICNDGTTLELIGKLQDRIFAQGNDHFIYQKTIDNPENEWQLARILDEPFVGNVESVEKGENQIWINTVDALYQVTPVSVQRKRPLEDWEIRGLSLNNNEVRALLFNSQFNSIFMADWIMGRARMGSVPYSEKIGIPVDLAVVGGFIYLLGEKGVLVLPEESIDYFPLEPEVSLQLTANDSPILDILPHGTSELLLIPERLAPESLVRLEYRLGEGRWQTLSPEGTYLAIAGSGEYSIQYRGTYPNGVRSDVEEIFFKIAYPWYQKTGFLAAYCICFIIVVFFFYRWRHWALERNNRWLRAEVKKQTRELEAATEAKTSFLAGISHDIRNPLNGILLIAESLGQKIPEGRNDKRLNEIKDLSIVVDQMLGEVLDFATVDLKKVPLQESPVGVHDLLNTTVNQQAWAIKRALIQVNTIVPDQLSDVAISADRNWLLQVLSNLLVNAINYSGSELIETGAKLVREEENYLVLEFYVRDWGKGIPDKEKEAVFGRFYRGENGIRSGKHGTGLGLSICREVIQAMGAELVLRDNHPKGSYFLVRGRWKKESKRPVPDAGEILGGLADKRVLIVEDLDYNRNAMVEFFDLHNCVTDDSADGIDALNKLDANTYDLVLMDWDLPGLSGPEVVKKYRASNPDDPVKIFALTAYSDLERKEESMRSGMNGFIGKPLTAQRLVYALANQALEESPVTDESAVPGRNEQLLNDSIREHLNEAEEAFDRGDLDAVRINAHKLTTLALIEGNSPKQKLCREIQEFCRQNDRQKVQTLLKELLEWQK